MRFKKLITPLLFTVIICATLALGYQQDPPRSPNPFSGAGQTLKKYDQSAEVKDLYSRITNLESKFSLLEMRIEDLQISEGTPCAPLRESICVPEPYFQKPRVIPYQQYPLRLPNPFSGAGQTQKDPLRLPNPFSGAGQTLKKDDQSAEVKDLYSRITNLESKIYRLEKRIFILSTPFSGAGQTLKKYDQSTDVKELYSWIANLESNFYRLEKRIEDFQKSRVIPEKQK